MNTLIIAIISLAFSCSAFANQEIPDSGSNGSNKSVAMDKGDVGPPTSFNQVALAAIISAFVASMINGLFMWRIKRMDVESKFREIAVQLAIEKLKAITSNDRFMEPEEAKYGGNLSVDVIIRDTLKEFGIKLPK